MWKLTEVADKMRGVNTGQLRPGRKNNCSDSLDEIEFNCLFSARGPSLPILLYGFLLRRYSIFEACICYSG